jgi:V/A-type H+/Na+-transporting ATPase subunit E
MGVWGPMELFCRAITEEGRKEAEQILARARDEAGKMVAEAKERARKDFEGELHSKLRKAHAEAKRMVDSAELESRKRILSFREEVMREVLEALQDRLEKLRAEPSYADFLLNALREGIEHLPGKELIGELSPEDLETYSERLKEAAGGVSHKLELRSSDSLKWGLRVYSADQRLLYDNCLSARLKRMEIDIRQEIWRDILGNE